MSGQNDAEGDYEDPENCPIGTAEEERGGLLMDRRRCKMSDQKQPQQAQFDGEEAVVSTCQYWRRPFDLEDAPAPAA